jgi:hypothetical protein
MSTRKKKPKRGKKCPLGKKRERERENGEYFSSH